MENQIVNIEAAKKLAEQYKKLTVKDFKNASCKWDNKVSDSLSTITGFNRLFCTLCKKTNTGQSLSVNCNKCIHKLDNSKNKTHNFCSGQETYQAIENAKTYLQLKRAIQKRASFLEHLVRIAERLA